MAIDYFALADFRGLPQMSDTTTYSDARVEAVAAFVTSRIESVVGASFVARTHTEAFDGGSSLVLGQAFAQSLTSVTVDGVAVDTADLLLRSGVVRYKDGRSFTATEYGGVSVTYTAGYSTAAPADIEEAAMIWTRYRLLATNSNAESDGRRTSITNDVGGTINFVVAGKDHPSGYPDVDAVLIDWRDRLDVFGFA